MVHAAFSFGVTVEAFALSTGLKTHPLIASCIAAIEAHGIDDIGLFRVPGNTAVAQNVPTGFPCDTF